MTAAALLASAFAPVVAASFADPARFPLHLLFPLASSLLYVASALSLKRASVLGAGVWRSTFALNVAAAACFAVLPLVDPPPAGTLPPLWQPLVIALLFTAGQAFTMVALNKGDVSVATPVVGTKVIFVAAFVTLVVGDPLPIDYWASAGMSAAGIALLNLGGGGGKKRLAGGDARPPDEPSAAPTTGSATLGYQPRADFAADAAAARARSRTLALTVAASLSAAASYGLFDVLVRKYAPAWGVGRLLPAVMLASAVLSLGLWPLFEGPLRAVPRPARGPLLLGAFLLGAQAVLLVRTLGLHADTTRINVVYNGRGLWSVLAIWLVGHWWGNTERQMGAAALAFRAAGAGLLLGAIAVAVFRPIGG